MAERLNIGVVAGIEVTGLADLVSDLGRFGPEVRKAMNENLERIAEPVRSTAEYLALTKIRRIGLGKSQWWQMRTGITRRSAIVYVAPVKRGVKRAADPRARSNLADLLLDRSMDPALERNADRIEAEVLQLIDVVARDW